jgi:hypothetical protein
MVRPFGMDYVRRLWVAAQEGESVDLTCCWGDDGRETEEGSSAEDHNKVDI